MVMDNIHRRSDNSVENELTNEEMFDFIMNEKFSKLENELEIELDLIDRIKNPTIIVRFIWNTCRLTQLFFVHRNDQMIAENRDQIIDCEIDNLNSIKRSRNPNAAADNLVADNEFEFHRRYWMYYNPIKYHGDLPHYTRCPIRIYMLHLFNIYCFYLFSDQSLKTTQFLRTRERFRFQLKPTEFNHRQNQQQTGYCVRREDIYCLDTSINTNLDVNYNYSTNWDQLDSAHDILNSVGSPGVVHSALFVYCLEMCISFLFTCYLGFLRTINSNKINYVDSLSFYMSPISERRRLRRRLHQIVDNLQLNCHRDQLMYYNNSAEHITHKQSTRNIAKR